MFENKNAFELFSELSWWTLQTLSAFKAVPLSSKQLPEALPSFQKTWYLSVLSGQRRGRDPGGGRLVTWSRQSQGEGTLEEEGSWPGLGRARRLWQCTGHLGCSLAALQVSPAGLLSLPASAHQKPVCRGLWPQVPCVWPAAANQLQPSACLPSFCAPPVLQIPLFYFLTSGSKW